MQLKRTHRLTLWVVNQHHLARHQRFHIGKTVGTKVRLGANLNFQQTNGLG